MEKLKNDEFASVQIEAAKTLVKAGKTENAETIVNYLGGENKIVQLFAARAFEETWMLLPTIPEKVYKIYAALQESTKGKWYGHDLYAFWSLSQVFQNKKVNAPDEVNYGK